MHRTPSTLGRARWGVLAIAMLFVVSLFVMTAGAQAVRVDVLRAQDMAVPPSDPPTTMPLNGAAASALQVQMQLLPQALRQVIRRGVRVEVAANEAANGIAQVMVSRATAKRLDMKAGRYQMVVIGSGTVSQVKQGKVVLHLRLSHAIKAKLRHLAHVTLVVRLALVGRGGDHVAIDAAGRY